MKEFLYHGVALLAAGLLIYISGLWYEGDKVLGILGILLFALFLAGRKRRSVSSIGLVIVTVFYLFALDSIFFVQDVPIFICSLVMGGLLLPHFRQNRDAVSASLGFVLLNMLISLEFMPNEIMMWLIAFATGVMALIGFRFNYAIVKVCFAVLFALSALFLLVVQVFDGPFVLSVLAVLSIASFVIGMFRLNGKAAADSL